MPSLQNFQVIKQNIHSEGVPEEVCKKKIEWGCMNYHVFQKEIVNLCFPQKEKKKEAKKKNQIKIKITENRKECQEHYTIFMIQNLLRY